MGLLDNFRTKKPPLDTTRGGSGRAHTHGFLELEERNTDLIGLQGLRIYDRMYRSDPDVRRAVKMAINPILAANWSVEPFGGDEAGDQDRKCAEMIEWALMEFMSPNLIGHLAEVLPLLVRSGFTPAEQVWTMADYDGRQVIVPSKLAIRLPRSIYEFRQDKLGNLTEIVQYLPTAEEHIANGGMVTIPATNLVYYRVDAEGDNWEGTSLLRSAYKPWFYKDKIEQLAAIRMDREATGIPVAYVPDGANDAQRDSLETALANFRAGEAPYLMMPGSKSTATMPGWDLEIVGFGGGSGGADPSDLLEYFKKGIGAAFIEDFMALGQGKVGAKATADVQQDPYYQAVEGLASTVESQINETIVARMAALNFDVERPPKLKMSLVDSTSLTELADYVQKLGAASAITMDEPLEDYLRDKADFPHVDPEARKAAQEMATAAQEALTNPEKAAEQDPGSNKGGVPVATEQKKELMRQDRPLRSWEETMSLDAIENAIEGSRERFEATIGPVVLPLAQQIAKQVKRGRPAPAKPPTALVDAIASELDSLYGLGRQTVADELARQGGSTPMADLLLDQKKSLSDRASLSAMSILRRIIEAVSRSKFVGVMDAAQLQSVAEREGFAALRTEAISNAAAALNEGRTDEAEERSDEIKGTYYTSILDGRRCSACQAADDDVLRSLNDPVRVAHKPPNMSCEGGNACRCMEAYVLNDELTPAG